MLQVTGGTCNIESALLPGHLSFRRITWVKDVTTYFCPASAINMYCWSLITVMVVTHIISITLLCPDTPDPGSPVLLMVVCTRKLTRCHIAHI